MQNAATKRLPASAARLPKKEAARVQKQEPQAVGSKQPNCSLASQEEPAESNGLVANLTRRFREFNCGLISMADGEFLLSPPVLGGMPPQLLDLRASVNLLKQWEGR